MLDKTKVVFLVRRPEQIDFQWKEILRTFQPEVWLAALCVFIMVVVVHRLSLTCDPSFNKENWSGNVLVIFGHLTMTTSHNKGSRLTLTTWSIFCLILTTCLSTDIVTKLTLPLYTPRVDTKQQLVEEHYYWTGPTYKLVKSVYIKDFVFDPEDPWFIKFEQSYKYMEPEEIQEKVGSDKKIAFASQIYGKDLVVIHKHVLQQKAITKFRVAKESFIAIPISYGIKKHSLLKEPLTDITLRFIEAGLPQHWQAEVLRRWPIYDTRNIMLEEDVPQFGQPEPLPLNKLQPVFYLLLSGQIIATLVFFLEIRSCTLIKSHN